MDITQIFPCVNWQAVAALATLAAVLVALLPIWRETRRGKAHARSPRFGLCSKLTVLRPSLGAIVRGGHSPHPAGVLSPEAFREAVRSFSGMMEESTVLQKDEQDQLGVVLANPKDGGPDLRGYPDSIVNLNPAGFGDLD